MSEDKIFAASIVAAILGWLLVLLIHLAPPLAVILVGVISGAATLISFVYAMVLLFK